MPNRVREALLALQCSDLRPHVLHVSHSRGGTGAQLALALAGALRLLEAGVPVDTSGVHLLDSIHGQSVDRARCPARSLSCLFEPMRNACAPTAKHAAPMNLPSGHAAGTMAGTAAHFARRLRQHSRYRVAAEAARLLLQPNEWLLRAAEPVWSFLGGAPSGGAAYLDVALHVRRGDKILIPDVKRPGPHTVHCTHTVHLPSVDC